MVAAPSSSTELPSLQEIRADLQALPTDWRLCRVDGHKRPIGGKDWYNNDQHSADDALALNGTMPPAWGLLCGEASGVVVLDLDAKGWKESFKAVTGHPITDLPRTIGWSSGKPGRSAHALTVPMEWWPHLANRQSFEADGVTLWELRWNRCQSVILGAHPETGHYRWLPGRSPHEIRDPAVAPDWLLDALLVQEAPEVIPSAPTANDAERAMVMLRSIPAATCESYSDWLGVGMALHSVDPGLLMAWVDWCRGMANFDEAECLRKWESFGKGHRGRPVTIASLHHLAKQHGYVEPKQSKPDLRVVKGGNGTALQEQPVAEEPLREAEKAPAVDPLDQWEELLRHMLDPEHGSYEQNSIRRQIRAATLAQEACLRVSPDQVRKRLRQIQRDLTRDDRPKGTAGGQVATITEKEFIVGELIAKGCLTGIAAFNKVGKTKLAVRIAADLIFQQPLMGRFPVAPGPHPIVLWLTDQPAADSAEYLKAVGLMDPTGRLHSQILKLYTEEDDLHWDDEGADRLLELAAKHPGMVLITDSFFANVQRIHGSDNDPEAGGALIDVQTLLAPYGVTHVCLFHSSKEIGNVGIAAIRGHSSAGGAVSACISLHFMERKCPQTGKWVADKENPHRRMVVEGRGAYQDLLIRGDFAAGTFEVVGDYQRAIAEIVADDRKAAALEDLTPEQREVLEAIGGANDPNGVTVRRIAEIVHGTDAPSKAQITTIRKQCQSMRGQLLSEGWHLGTTVYRPRTD